MIKESINRLLQPTKNHRPLIIGIAGGSGAGKSTIARKIQHGLHSYTVNILGLDTFFKRVEDLPTYYSDYHGEHRPNFNRPDSLRVDDMIAYCMNLSGADVVIFEGHFALYYPQMRQLMNIKCFVDIDLNEMLSRRTRRNLARGYGGDADTIAHYNAECVVPQYHRYIEPTKAYADIIIPNTSSSITERDHIIETLCQKILCTKNTHSRHAVRTVFRTV